MLGELETVEHCIVVGDGDASALTATAPRCTATTSCSRPRPTTFDWPEIDERDAAAMCYTSGTTGNPKGVAYSHRSMYLHSLRRLHERRARPRPSATRILPIVPMFHAKAWGIPYAAFMVGASLVMPGRFLQAGAACRA